MRARGVLMARKMHARAVLEAKKCTRSEFSRRKNARTLGVFGANKNVRDLETQIGDLADDVSGVLYADDVLIVDQHGELADIYMQRIRKQGLYYGLQLNWNKLMFMSVNCSPTIRKPDGQCINRVHSMSYLGGLLSDDGTIASELGRRIGLAYFDFFTLQCIWSHANISRKRKVSLFNTLVLSKLMYAFDTMWLSKIEINRLNAFQNKCLLIL